MIRPTCVKCKRELVCEKNEVPVIHFTDNDRDKGIDVLRFGDIWKCENCGYQLIMGMGNQILGLDLTERTMQEILNREFVEVIRGN